MTSERQKEKQELAKQYVKAHNIEKVVGEMLNSVLHAKADKPLVFMVKADRLTHADPLPFQTAS